MGEHKANVLRTNTDLGNAQETANQARNAITILTLGLSFGLSFLLLASFEVGPFRPYRRAQA
jgi:hypothetical protein